MAASAGLVLVLYASCADWRLRTADEDWFDAWALPPLTWSLRLARFWAAWVTACAAASIEVCEGATFVLAWRWAEVHDSSACASCVASWRSWALTWSAVES